MKHFIDSKKTVLAFVLTLTLLVTMLPVGVFADSHTVVVHNNNELEGSYEISSFDAVPGEVVTITTTALENVNLSMFEVTYVSNGAYTVDEPSPVFSDESGVEVYQFTMPAVNVEVYLDFISKEDEDVHRVIKGNTEHGTIAVNVLVLDENNSTMQVTTFGKAKAGNRVEIIVSPDSNYRPDKIWVDPYSSAGETITPQRVVGTNNKYIFTMPDYAVTINATFVPGPFYSTRDKVSVGLNKVDATANIRSADKGAYTKANTFDHVEFAGKSWSVVSNDTANHKMVLLCDDVVGSAVTANQISSALTTTQVGITQKADIDSLVKYTVKKGDESFTDYVTDAFGETVKIEYTNNTSFTATPFLLSINDIRNCTKYEDQLKFDKAWWLGSTSEGEQAYVGTDGIVKTGSNTGNIYVRPAVVIDTSKVVLVYHNSVSLPYTTTQGDVDGYPGQTWKLVMHDANSDQFAYRSAYRVTNMTTMESTNNLDIVVKNSGAADQLLIVKDGQVVYYGKVAGVGTKYTYNNALNNYDSKTHKLYVLQGTGDYTSVKCIFKFRFRR